MVILLDKHKKPAGFTTEAHLRRLMEKHMVVIYRRFPCVAILTKRDVRDFENIRSFRIKIDPGAKKRDYPLSVTKQTKSCFLFRSSIVGSR